MKTIERKKYDKAVVLTPSEMNAIHFSTGLHSDLPEQHSDASTSGISPTRVSAGSPSTASGASRVTLADTPESSGTHNKGTHL